MSNKCLYAMSVLTVAFLVGSAQASEQFTAAASSDWFDANNWTAGVPDPNFLALVGTSSYPGVSTSINARAVPGGLQVGVDAAGDLTIAAGGSLVIHNNAAEVWDVLTIGASGGSSVTATATLSNIVDLWGWYYVSSENEYHSLDIGAKARANVTIEANTVIQTAADIGVGMDGYWDTGYATTVYQGPGSFIKINSGNGMLLLGRFDSNAEPVHYIMDHAKIRGGMFHVGGTLELRGPNFAWAHPYRARSYAGAGRTILKLVGEGASLTTWEGLQLRGVRVDVSEFAVAETNTWVTFLDGTEGDSFWPDKDIDFIPGTDPDWLMQLVYDGSGTKLVQIMYVPEPATLAILALGACLPLLRRRR